jgi:hypothetical protein
VVFTLIRCGPTAAGVAPRHIRNAGLLKLDASNLKEIHMPVILWLLGVPVLVVLLLMFLHII